MLLDARSLAPVGAIRELLAETDGLELPGTLKTELHASVVELNTEVCASVAEAVAAIGVLRARTSEGLGDLGLVMAAAGSHPFAEPEELPITDEKRYEEMVGYEHPGRFQAPTFCQCMAVILDFGTEEQKRRHVPPMLRGETLWAQFLSEPTGGSSSTSRGTRPARSCGARSRRGPTRTSRTSSSASPRAGATRDSARHAAASLRRAGRRCWRYIGDRSPAGSRRVRRVPDSPGRPRPANRSERRGQRGRRPRTRPARCGSRSERLR